MVPLCSRGLCETAGGGRADEKLHSSSSLVGGAARCDGGGVKVGELIPARAANGSVAAAREAGGGGGGFAGCCSAEGCGVLDCDAAGVENDANCENEEVWLGTGPLALLSWVTDDSSAGPGMSDMAMMLVSQAVREELRVGLGWVPPRGCLL